tara:strand:- start:1892 stop:2116 length:225 start_codon:yes stop_codon:yes gene_type:complete
MNHSYSVLKRLAKEYVIRRKKKTPFVHKGQKYKLKDIIKMLKRMPICVKEMNGKYSLDMQYFPEFVLESDELIK